ncbi:MAG: nuclease [Cyanobacteriota bacterium]|jgi:adenine-specific DNA-methyltransferase
MQIQYSDVIDLVKKNQNEGNELLDFNFNKNSWLNKILTFSNTSIEKIIDKIKSKTNFNFDPKNEVAQGIVAPQDFLNKSGWEKLDDNYHIGEGIFNLSNKEKNSLKLLDHELQLIRPFYTTEELIRYYGNSLNKLWIIYTDSSFKKPSQISDYPNIKRHLDRFKSIITSDNKPYGLHRARNEYFFVGEKIISLRKCKTPTFTYTDFDCYVSQTFFVIKTNRINQKYLTGLLNSYIVAFWLKYQGKMQGGLFQIDKAPILEIPILDPSEKDKKAIELLVQKCLDAKGQNCEQWENEIDRLVYELYGLTEEEISIIEKST